MSIEVKQLRFFVQIAEQANLSRAARLLGMTQPALSHHLSSLEAYLGVRLFSRSTHGMQLTEAGSRLLVHAQAILERVIQAEAELRDPGTEDAVLPVVIGMSPSVANTLSLPLMRRLQEGAPQIRIRYVEWYTPMLLDGLSSSRVDMAVLHTPPDQNRLESIKLAEESLCLVTGAPVTGAEGGQIEFRKLVDLPLALPTFPQGFREELEHAAEDLNLTLNFIAEVQSINVAKNAIEQGLYSAILPPSMLYEDIEAGKLFAYKILGVPFKREMWLTHPKSPPLTRAGRIVKRELLALVQSFLSHGIFGLTPPAESADPYVLTPPGNPRPGAVKPKPGRQLTKPPRRNR